VPQVFENKHVRAVRVFTEGATFDGLLSLTLLGRTLDELNASSRIFLPLESPAVVSGEFPLASSQLAVNKASILFVLELDDPGTGQALPHNSPHARRFARSVLSLRLRGYRIDGHVQVVERGDALGRLNQAGHPFLALTSASVVGPGIEFATPFLAVNRNHVLFGQETFRLRAAMEEALVPETRHTSD